MNGWEITIIIAQAMRCGIALAKDGQPKKQVFSWWGQIVGSVITVFVLYKAGLFQ